MTDQSKFAYLAGFLDGEGCFSITHNRNGSAKGFSYAIRICAVSTNLEVLEWIQSHFGGNVLHRRVKNWQPQWKLSYEWRFTSTKKIENLLLGLLPYLVIKKEQAKVALEYVKLSGRNEPSIREDLFLRMKKLNFRGVDLNSQTTNTLNVGPIPIKNESELAGDSKSASVKTQTA